MFRQPLGVVAAITPFNFPAMIPLWFLPYAVACGNCFILKPSEKVPMTSARLIELIERAGFPQRRGAGGQRREGDGRRAARSPADPRGLVRRLDAGGEVCLQPRDGQRQARAVPGRRQEPGDRAARRGYGDDHANRGRLGLRLRRPALPGLVDRDHRRRGARSVPRQHRRGGRQAQGRLRPRPGGRDGAGDHRREQAADRDADRQGPERGRRGAGRRARRRPSPATSAASSSGRRSWTMSTRAASSPGPRSSGRC